MKKISRLIVLMLAVAAVLSCQSRKSSAVEDIFIPGEYSGSAMGLGGDVTVNIVVDYNKIIDISISGANETLEIGGSAIDLLSENILENGDGSVDTISGATVTSKAVKTALDAALAAARGEIAVYKLKDGKYVTRAMGHENYINVVTVFKDEQIQSCKVVSHDETMGIGNFAAARVPERIVASQSLLVDSVAGASVSSAAIKAAVTDAIKQAGGDFSAFMIPLEAPALSDEIIEEHVDVVIAGAGTSGLMAGARLSDMGYNVLIFEKADIPGGAMPMTYGGILSGGSKAAAEYGQGREQQDPYWNKNILMKILENYVKPEFDRFNKAMPYKTAMMDSSGGMVDWMRKIGIGFEPMGRYEGGLQLGLQPYMSPGVYQGGAGYSAMFLADRITVQGSRIIYATPVVSLTTDSSGTVNGLVAEGKDGRTWNIRADAVMLATGGFASNPDMIAEYYPEYEGQFFNGVSGNTGEGIVMAMEQGAAIECMGRPLGAFPAVYGSNFEVAFIDFTVPGLMVNGNGNPVHDSSHVGLGNAKLDMENGGRFYYFFDEEGVEAMKKSMAYGFSYASVFERDEVLHFKSVEDAAGKLDLPGLPESVEINNENAMAGKRRVSYLETREGIYAIRIEPNFYLTTGGLVIDTKARVLDENGKPVSNLYAAGDVAGSIEEKDGSVYGYGFPSAMTYGYIAAETISDNIR